MHRIVALLTLSVFALACGDRRAGTNPRTSAAIVSDSDVRRLPPERKATVPDVMLSAADRGRMLGADSARVQMYIISDLQCAACKRWHTDVWPSIRATYVDQGLVRVIFVHYPLRDHANAVLAASAAQCASAQGQFWPVVNKLFETQLLWASASAPSVLLDSLAAVPGVDLTTLHNCTASHRVFRQIHADINWADNAKLGEPPMILVGTHRLSATSPLATIRAAVDSALAGK